MDELIAAYQFVYALLVSDATLAGLAPGGVHMNVAPATTPTPHVVVSMVSAEDANGLGMTRVLTNVVMQAASYITGNQVLALGLIQHRIDQLLQGASGSAPNGGYIYGSERLRSFIVDGSSDTRGRVPYSQGVNQYALSARAAA